MNNIQQDIIEKYTLAADYVHKQIGKIPRIAIIAGSGVGESLENCIHLKQIFYSDIPNFPKVTVIGHSGKIIITEISGIEVMLFSGRFHYYEGKSIEEVLSIMILIKILGIEKVIISNAAGGLNSLFNVGDLMLIEDTINFNCIKINSIFERNKISPIRNINEWQNLAKKSLIESGLNFKVGTYLMVTGASYESRAEIGMMRRIGADAVGMSTVPELLFSQLMGIVTFSFSLITNLAKEVVNKVSHQEVLNTAELSKKKIFQTTFR